MPRSGTRAEGNCPFAKRGRCGSRSNNPINNTNLFCSRTKVIRHCVNSRNMKKNGQGSHVRGCQALREDFCTVVGLDASAELARFFAYRLRLGVHWDFLSCSMKRSDSFLHFAISEIVFFFDIFFATALLITMTISASSQHRQNVDVGRTSLIHGSVYKVNLYDNKPYFA